MSGSSVSAGAVYDWASVLTAEGRGRWFGYWENRYYWPREILNLYHKLLSSRSRLIAVVGCSGVGKSSARMALNHALVKHYESSVARGERRGLYEIKFGSLDFEYLQLESFLNAESMIWDGRLRPYYDGYMIELKELLERKFKRFVESVEDMEEAETELRKKACQMARRKVFMAGIGQYANLLIDLPDYSRTNRRGINRYLNWVQDLWQGCSIRKRAETNLVVFAQEDNLGDHSFLGKMEVVRIKPLDSEQLFKAYTRIFGNSYPFTDEALLYLARLSQGVFRRFLGYISTSLEKCVTPEGDVSKLDQVLAARGPLDLGFVQEAITQEQLSRDLEATLARYFPKNIEGRHIAVRILELLGRKQDMNQKTIAQQLDLPEYAMSRIMSSLEAARLVTKKKVGLDKLVRLTESD